MKIFDSYLDTLAQVIVPFIFEKEIEISRSSGSFKIHDLPNLSDLLVKSMSSNDVFNFGSFVLAIVTDFHFDPIMTVASGTDLNLDKISGLLMKKLESQHLKENLKDFIELCINPDEYQRVEFGMLLNHSFVLEWNARIVREIASQPANRINGNEEDEQAEIDAMAMSLLANDQTSGDVVETEGTGQNGGMVNYHGPTRSNADFSPMICYGKGRRFRV